jgi:glutamate synthase (NADPH/NADH) large chain
LSGGRVIVRPDRSASFVAERNVVAGNVAAYGATSGELFVRGVVGERFCVRNSGVTAVVEGTGDHACEYMTGGAVVILGPTGRNLAAGMSGGEAYVLDLAAHRVNLGMVEIELPSADELETVRALIQRHVEETGSTLGETLLADWPAAALRFSKIMPRDYKRVLAARAAAERDGRDVLEAIMEAAHG